MEQTTEPEGVPLLQIHLIERPDEQGTARTNVGDGRYLMEASGFSITVRELHAAHGYWIKSTNPGEKASLLVLRIQAVDHYPSRGRRFKSIRVGIRFSSTTGNNASGPDGPYISTFAPAKDETISFLSTKVLRQKKQSGDISLNVDASQMPIVANASLSGEKGWMWGKDVPATMTIFSKQQPFNKSRKGDNYVEWIIGENNYAKRIASSCDVAILLRRPDDSPFKMEFPIVEATIDAGFAMATAAHKAKENIKKLLGLNDEETELPKSHTYNPSEQGTHPTKESFKKDEMHLLEEGSVLEEYAFIRTLGEVRGVRGGDTAA
ncbi:hypothetical protein GP486_006882 [Trichoglossum hirsutum]|uniref:Uncharacterized protein n=1 Tax=Trichoglossum hirsutum TaxID=265104 RepID=A0A9P8ICS5_9PEZI|nr:hypothetical protein GP486_006882 [Trichoglossum hirsutum]